MRGQDLGFRGSSRTQKAHRVAYEQFRGPIPDGMTIDHLCGNPGCVNPDHLEPVTALENTRRAARVRTSCKRGHPYTVENTISEPQPDGRVARRCRTCRRAEQQQRRIQREKSDSSAPASWLQERARGR